MKMKFVLSCLLVSGFLFSQLGIAAPSASGNSFGPIVSAQSPSSTRTSSSSASSSSNSSNNPASDSSNQSLGQSVNSSNASTNASLSIPGRIAKKIPGKAVDVSTASENALRLKEGWVISFASKIFDPQKPSLVLMPGIFRGLEKEEECLRSLEALKINYVAIHFSTHTKSIVRLEKNETPHFEGGEPHLSEVKFAQEVEAVSDYLKLKKPIVVALSYSAAVVPFLNPVRFPVVIEVAPMGRPDETNLIGSAAQKSWEQWLQLNPFYGPEFVVEAKNQYLHSIWNPVVQFLSTSIVALKDEKVSKQQVDAFVAMTFAAENFDLTKSNFNSGLKIAWIIAESEDPTRAYFQSQAIQKYLATLDQKTLKNSIFGEQGVLIIKGSGHAIPQEQPALYASALKEIVDRVESEKTFRK